MIMCLKRHSLNFLEYDITWVKSKLSGAIGSLRAEEIELQNWLIFFGCVSEELIVIVAKLDD